jgi:hypothetical protein
MKKLLILVMLCPLGSMSMYAQSAADDSKTFIGINAGHMIIVNYISREIDANAPYVPIHFNGYHSLNKNFALAGSLLCRSEKDYGYHTMEFGFAVGPCYTSNYLNGFYADFKVGLAYATGRNYYSNNYSRTDFVIQPEAGYFIKFASRFTMTVGLGCQSLLRITENPRREESGWDWVNTEKMAHYYLPVLNISLGIKL